MAKFINNCKTAILNRRAAAAGLSLEAIKKALQRVSEKEILTEHLFPRNPDKDMSPSVLEEILPLYVEDSACDVSCDGSTLVLTSHNGDYSNTYLFDGAVWRHQGGEDHFWSAQCSNHLHHSGYYLFAGVRAKVAAAMEVECDNSFHWAFDQVVGGQ